MQTTPKISTFLSFCLLATLQVHCGTGKAILERIHPSTDNGKGAEALGDYGDPLALTEARQVAAGAPDVSLGLTPYASCDELKGDMEATLHKKWLSQKADIAMSIKQSLYWQNHQNDNKSTAAQSSPDAAVGSAAPTAAETIAQDGKTNVQEKDVDEADKFKVGLDQIFTVGFNQLNVVDRKSLKMLGVIDLDVAGDAQLFTVNHQLIVIQKVFKPVKPLADSNNLGLSQTASSAPVSGPIYSPDGGYGAKESTVRVQVYSTAAGSMPKLLKTTEFDGSYVDSRLIGNRLVLVLNDQLHTTEESIEWSDFSAEAWYGNAQAKALFTQRYSHATRPKSLAVEDDRISGIPCTSISHRKVADFDMSFAKTYSIDISVPTSEAFGLGFIGQGDEIYVSADSIYLLKSKLEWFRSGYFTSYNWEGTADEKVYIRQITFDGSNGQLKAAAEGEVPGHIKDRWSLHAANSGKNLLIATSTGILWEHAGPNIAQNHLFALTKDDATKSLQIAGSIRDFGTQEDIRSVRYVDKTAYIVTFKKTDPLYAFDISDAASPKLLSGLKVPGFSTYLHPLANGRLLGIGFDALDQGDFAFYQGIQVSLFDTSDPMAMARIDNHIYGTRGSGSDVTSNPHAFFFDESTQIIGMPLVELSGDALKGQSTSRVFSGALLLKMVGDKLVEQGRLSHEDLLPSECISGLNQVQWWSSGVASLDINRLYRIDGRLVTLSAFGLKAYDFTNFKAPIVSTSFNSKSYSCANRPN